MTNIPQMLEDCIEADRCENTPFSKWESDFVQSVDDNFSQYGRLSPRQHEVLERIWEKI